MTIGIVQVPVKVNVRKKIYALFDPTGKLRRCGETIDLATNYLVPEMDVDFWNALFGATPKKRVEIFKEHGWLVITGTFKPDAEVTK